MRDSTYRISLDIHDILSQVQITAKQNDNARKIIVNLMEKGKPYVLEDACRAVLMIKKPDNNILYNDCDIINNGSAISYEFTSQTTTTVGINRCELRVYGTDNKVLTSPRFTMLICTNVFQDGQVTSTSEYSALTEAMSDIDEFEEAVTNAVTRVDAALERETDILNKASAAVLSATLAKASELNAKTSEINAKGSEDNSRYYANSIHDDVLAINRKLGFAEFDIDSNGNLVYTDNSPYTFGVSENGDLTWEVENE